MFHAFSLAVQSPPHYPHLKERLRKYFALLKEISLDDEEVAEVLAKWDECEGLIFKASARP